jgi:hypothetical protein
VKGVSSEFDSNSKNEAEKEGKDGWGDKRDRQTNVLISKSGKQLGALWTMEDAGSSGLGRGSGGSLTTMPRCSSQEQEQLEAALAEMTRVERVGKYGEYSHAKRW